MTKATTVAMVTKKTMAAKVLNHTSLYDHLATDALVDHCSQVPSSAILLKLPMVGN
jgi:hypothetical protein